MTQKKAQKKQEKKKRNLINGVPKSLTENYTWNWKKGKKVLKKTKPKPKVGNDVKNARRAFRMVQQDAGARTKDAIVNEIAKTDCEDVMNVVVTINPCALAQFIWGHLGRALAETSRAADYNAMVNYFLATLYNFQDTESVYWSNAPLAFVQLRKALEPRRIRNYQYTPDWTALGMNVRAQQARSTTADPYIPQGIWGINLKLLSSTPTADGFGAVQSPAILANPGIADASSQYATTDWEPFLGQFNTVLRPVAYDRVKEDYSDASAFAFSLTAPSTSDATNGGGAKRDTLAWWCGGNNPSTNFVLLPAVNTMGLETPIKRPWWCQAGVGVECPRYLVNISTPAGTAITDKSSVRTPRFVQRVWGPPSLLGWNEGGNFISGVLQLRTVPATRLLQQMVNRLEAVGKVIGAQWLTLAATDVILYAWMLLRNYVRRYSGLWAGVRHLSEGATAAGGQPEYHAGMNDSSSLKAPQAVLQLLGASTPSMGKPTTLIPWMFSPNPAGITTTLAYTGVSITLLNDEFVMGNYFGALQKTVLLRTMENLMAQYTNMAPQSELGPSFLDCSIAIGVTSGNVLRLGSRRHLNEELRDAIFNVFPAVSYYSCPDVKLDTNTTTFDVYPATGGGNQSYNERSSLLLTGNNLTTVYDNASIQQGVVNNGFTSNIAENTGEARPLPAPYSGGLMMAQPLRDLKKADPGTQSTILKWAKRLIPRAGNYCGPGWTAGVDTGDVEPILSASKQYLVPPTSEEDAVCKRHDEAYARAGKDQLGIDEADSQMVRELDLLAGTRGLSLYAHAARLAIRAKLSASRKFQDLPESLALMAV